MFTDQAQHEADKHVQTEGEAHLIKSHPSIRRVKIHFLPEQQQSFPCTKMVAALSFNMQLNLVFTCFMSERSLSSC